MCILGYPLRREFIALQSRSWMRTDEIGDEEEDVLRVRLRGGEVDRDFWVDDLDGLISTAVGCFAHHRRSGRGVGGGVCYDRERKGKEERSGTTPSDG